MADAVVTGIGAAWQFLNVIMVVKDKVTFETELENLQSILTPIISMLGGIEQLNREANRPREELAPLISKMEEGTQLVSDCSKVRGCLNLCGRYCCKAKLKAFTKSFKNIYSTVMLAQIARDLKDIRRTQMLRDDIQPTSNRDLFLPARKLYIAWVENPDYWRWNSDHPNIGEVAELVKVYFLAVSGWVDTSTLEENTRYEAYLVYSLRNNATGFKNKPVEVFLNVIGHEDQNSKQKVFLEAPATPWTPGETSVTSPLLHGHSVQRDDGWKEVKLGEFLNDQDKELEVGMNHTEGKLKTGIVIRGIQIRPKLQNQNTQ
ncbi:hypothetical protein AAZX31_03G032400 [Glycine max]|nr:hypothetical protein JHK86_006244 [Glycine max]